MKDEKEPRLQEVTERMPEPGSTQDCAFCSILCRNTEGEGRPDASSLHFMTEREIQALAAMRRLKKEASEVKGRMRQAEERGMSEDGKGLSEQLAELRAEWKKMDRERMDAAEERMRLLGHIQ
jgi:hypothetical protein